MRKPRISIVVDSPGWCHDMRAENLKRVLEDRYAIGKVYQDHLPFNILGGSDIVVVNYFGQCSAIPALADWCRDEKQRVLMGVCSLPDTSSENLKRVKEHASHVFCISPEISDRILPQIGEHRVLLNGVDSTFFKPDRRRRPKSQFNVGWAGSLASRGPEFRGYDLIQKAVEGIPGAVLQTADGKLSWDQMVGFYQSLHVYVCASESEGTPNPCMEAAACGVPVITTAVGVMPHFVQQGINGLFVTRDVAAIRRAIEFLMGDPVLVDQMGLAAMATVKNGWDWEHRGTSWARTFDEILEFSTKAQ